MDDYDRNNLEAPSDDEDEYDALNDPRQVMAEVVTLVKDLHQAATRLGDAIAKAGLPAREWRDADSRLLLLADQFPDITLDALITRLAEFAADLGPHWLHGSREDIAHFTDEVSILYNVARPLRTAAQRLRMLPARDRGDLPIERAFGDARVGTPLDRVAALLRDLESLAPFVEPLTPAEWSALAPQPPTPSSPPAPSSPSSPPPPVQGSDPAAATGATPRVAGGAGATLMQPLNTQDVPQPPTPPPFSARVSAPPPSSGQTFRRLRDFLPPDDERHSAERDWSWLRADASVRARTILAWVMPRKWLIAGVVVMLFALSLALLALVRAAMPPSVPLPVSHLTVAPTQIALACSGKNDTIKLALHDTGTQSLTWSITPPAGLSLSSTHGTLKPGASATVTVTVTSTKVAHGTLRFTSNDGAATTTYVVSCR